MERYSFVPVWRGIVDLFFRKSRVKYSAKKVSEDFAKNLKNGKIGGKQITRSYGPGYLRLSFCWEQRRSRRFRNGGRRG